MNLVVEVIYSPRRNSKIEIFRRENGTYGFAELRFAGEEKCWIPFGRYSEAVVDSVETAIREARGRVSWLDAALKPNSYSLTWIRELSGDPEAEFISQDIPVLGAGDPPEPLTPKQILQVGGQFLVETVDMPDDWFMGSRQADGPIICWGPYGDLERAIRSL